MTNDKDLVEAMDVAVKMLIVLVGTGIAVGVALVVLAITFVRMS